MANDSTIDEMNNIIRANVRLHNSITSFEINIMKSNKTKITTFSKGSRNHYGQYRRTSTNRLFKRKCLPTNGGYEYMDERKNQRTLPAGQSEQRYQR